MPSSSLLLVRGPTTCNGIEEEKESTTLFGPTGGAAAVAAPYTSSALHHAASSCCTSNSSTSQQEQDQYSSSAYQQQYHRQQQEIQKLRQQQQILQQIHQQQKNKIGKQQEEQEHQQYPHHNVTVSPIRTTRTSAPYTLPDNHTLHLNNSTASTSSESNRHRQSKPQQRTVKEINYGGAVLQYPPKQQGAFEGSHPPRQRDDHAPRRGVLEDCDEDSHLPQSIPPPLKLPPSALAKDRSQQKDDPSERSNDGKSRKRNTNDVSTMVLDINTNSTSNPLTSSANSSVFNNTTQKLSKCQHFSNICKKTVRKKSSTRSKNQYHHNLLAQKSKSSTNHAVSSTTGTRKETDEEKDMYEEDATTSSKCRTNRDLQETYGFGKEIDVSFKVNQDNPTQGPSTVTMSHEQNADGKEFEPGDPITPSGIHKIVVSVASWVAEEIRLCHYGYCGNSSAEATRKTEDSVSRADSAAVAIEKFAISVVFQNILASYAENAKTGHDEDDRNVASKTMIDSSASVMQDHDEYTLKLYERIVVAVLLNLREVLVANGTEMFGLEDEEKEKRHDNNDEHSEDFAVKIKCLSTAVVLNAASRLTDGTIRQRVLDLFLDAIEKYDWGNEEFVSCMKRLDVRAIGVNPKGQVMKRYENIAYRVSYNVARLNHHLISKHSTPYKTKIPPSNAVFVAHVERNKRCRDAERQASDSRKKQVLERYKQNMRKVLALR